MRVIATLQIIGLMMLLGCAKGTLLLQNTPISTTATPISSATSSPTTASASSITSANLAGIHKIQHIVIIMQENRSFDHYFGTFPGADGIPMQNGVPTVCVPDPFVNQCIQPYHDPNDQNSGGPHAAGNAKKDINGGKMDGFLKSERAGRKVACANTNDPSCSLGDQKPDVMGWHDAREIPNYWAYAQHFVLQDRMFEPNASWSLPEHLFMVSGWSAKCSIVLQVRFWTVMR